MPNFGPVITLAYERILGREPDPGGLETYNRSMNQGMSEAAMRESLLRSPEYANNNPGGAAAGVSATKPKKRAGATKKVVKKAR